MELSLLSFPSGPKSYILLSRYFLKEQQPDLSDILLDM